MLEKILNKPEAYRKKLAIVTTGTLFAAIFLSWATYRNFIFNGTESSSNLAAVEIVEVAETKAPFSAESASGPLDMILSKFKESFGSIKSSIESVMVPFMTGIEVYERE